MFAKPLWKFEVCVDSADGAASAQAGGAQRVELCDNLVEGGTTPSLGMLRAAREQIHIGLQVLIRPRGGDFCYSDAELKTMQYDIEAAQQTGADGVVLGLLTPDGGIDLPRTRQLVAQARPLSVTFHRAIDVCRDPYRALDELMELGVERVLTYGQQASALQGADCIRALVRQAAGRTIILVGGGVKPENIGALIALTGAQEYHFTARSTRTSPMRYRNLNCVMGKAYQPDEYVRRVTQAEQVQAVIAAAEQASRA